VTASQITALFVVSEVYPLIKTGGLADVAGALPQALLPEGVRVVMLMPGYPSVLDALHAGETIHDFHDLFGAPTRLIYGRANGLELIVIDAPHLYGRPGGPYHGPNGKDWGR